MAKYYITFWFGTPGNICRIEVPERHSAVDVAKEGFWVDKDLRWCMASEVVFFIMPHMVTSLVKVSDGQG